MNTQSIHLTVGHMSSFETWHWVKYIFKNMDLTSFFIFNFPDAVS